MSQEDVVVKSKDQIRIFLNDSSCIAIVQECWPEDDSVIAFDLEDAEVIAQTIMSLARHGNGR